MGTSAMPPDLLRAVVDRQGKVAFVVGAGCSLESPTDLLLSSVYSERAFERLKRDGVLKGALSRVHRLVGQEGPA